MPTLHYPAEAILHALVASALVEALLSAWRVSAPGFRLRLRLLALSFPAVVLPFLWIVVPVRRTDWFADHWALLALSRWQEVQVAGLRPHLFLLVALAGAGALLYLVDAIPFLVSRFARAHLRASAEPGPALQATLSGLASRARVTLPKLVAVDTSDLLLFVRGPRQPALVISTGALERLDDDELRAAVAHELAHVIHGDLRLGWVLFAVRTAMFFNPFVQLMARAIVRDTERRADRDAAEATRDPAATASAVIKLMRPPRSAAETAVAPAPVLSTSVLAAARASEIATRCRALLVPVTRESVPFAGLRMVLAGGSLAALLFFVV